MTPHALKRLVFACLILAPSFAYSQSDFAQTVVLDYGGDFGPQLPVMGDFNGDSRPDIAYFTGNRSPKLHVIYNNGDNTYRSTEFELGFYDTNNLEVGDFNEDGKDDLLVGKGLRLFLSTGESFEDQIVGGGSIAYLASVLKTDYNDDDHLDLILFVPDGEPTLYLGDGTGAFTTSNLEGLEGLIGTVAHIDLNNDNQKDFVGVTTWVDDIYNTNALIYLKTEDGYARSEIDVDYNFSDVTVHDFTGDLIPDIAVVGSLAGSKLEIFGNNGDGTFSSSAVYPVHANAGKLDYADYDNDGLEDIVVGSYSANTFYVFHNTGSGFEDIAHDVSRDWGVWGILFADMYGDDVKEIVRFQATGFNVYKLVDGKFSFDFNAILDYNMEFGFAVDLDNDGLGDLVSGTFGTGAIAIRFNIGEFTFTNPVYHKPEADIELTAIVAEDLNGDNFKDLIYTGKGSAAETGIFYSNTGVFQMPDVIARTDLRYIAVADFNNDGHMDLAGQNAILIGDAGGNFTRLDHEMPEIDDIAAGDFNDDGLVDLVAVGEEKVFLALNSGTDPMFPEFVDMDIGPQMMHVVVGFFNDDNLPDFISRPDLVDFFKLNINNGDGTFESTEFSVPFGYLTANPYVGDVDGDGRTDLVVPYQRHPPNDSIGVIIYKRDVTGDFTIDETINAHDEITPFYVSGSIVDMNGDGEADIVSFATKYDGTISIMATLAAPAVQAGNLTVKEVGVKNATLSVEGGSGDGRVIFIRKNDLERAVPVDEQMYSQNAYYLYGSESDVEINLLEENTAYIATAYEFASAPGGRIKYLVSDPPEVEFTTDIITGIKAEVHDIVVYPNPAKNSITINADNSSAVSIIDPLGRVHLATTGTTIDVSHLSRGYYIVEIGTSAGIVRKRIVLE